MNIIIIANFPGHLDGRRDKDRFLYLGEMLCDRGHNVTMLVSDFDHESKCHRGNDSINQNAYKTQIVALHEIGYPNNVCVKRLWSHYIWGKNVEKYLKSHEMPDVIYSAIPSLTANMRAAKICEKNGIRLVIDVQDLWPEAFVLAVKSKILQKGLKPLGWYVNQIYKRADIVVAVSETYASRALSVNKKTKESICVYLGNDGALFEEARNNGAKIQKLNSTLYLCYIGTMGYSYDIPCVLEAMRIFNNRPGLPKLKLVAMGSGPLLMKFKEEALQKGVDCDFTGSLPYSEMVAKMCSCDIVVNPIVKNGAQSITNKVGDYALSGLPVVSTQENTEYRNLVEDYRCGINCRVGDAQDLANALEALAKDSALRKKMGENAHKLGVERFDRRVTYNRLVEAVEFDG